MRAGAVVLAGGRSSRMGQPKALLDWHGLTAVEHAVEVVRDGIGGGPVCVVRAPGQELPPLDAIVVDDPIAFDGPLAALYTGLVALEGKADVAFACGVDTPLLGPAFVRVVVRALLDDGAGGLRDIPRTCAVRQVGEWELISDPELDAADPRLNAAANANTPEEWAALQGNSAL